MLEKLIQRSSQRRLVIAVIATVVLLEVFAVNARYFYNLVAGPFPLTAAEVTAIDNPDQPPRYRVTLQGDQSYDTGFEYLASSDGPLVFSYAALRFGDRLLLVQLNGRTRDNIPRRLTGELMQVPGAVRVQVLEQIFAADPSQREVFLPYMLYARDFTRNGYFGLIGLLILLIGSLYLSLTGLLYWYRPSSHPAARTLRPYGDPLTIAHQIEARAQVQHTVISNFHFINDWLVYFSPSTLEAVRFSDIVWIYKKVTQQRANSAAVGKTYLVCICSRHGNILTHIAPESQANEMLARIAQSAPWAITGDSPELQRQWRFDRSALIAAVDSTRSGTFTAD
ncbi:MAG TPA: DUF6709 family protein [Phototrophicaceae bacterium]|jgi:hypothetical protein|nr:DUF6709 family protein [Phototrophicaceae bacterium]